MLKQVFLVVCVAAGIAARKCAAKAPRAIVAGLLTVALNFGPPVKAGSEAKTEGWGENFEKAEALSREKGLPMVVHFHAHWCGPCRTMESEVLSSAEVHSVLGSGIIGVKVNSDDRRDLVSRFGISSLPTDVIVSPDGKILSKDVGSPGRSGYVARLGRFRVPSGAPAGNSNSLLAQVPGTPAKTPVTAVSQEGVTNDSLADAAHVGERAVPQNAGFVVPVDQATAEKVTEDSVVAMTKTLRRESDRRIGLNGYSPVSLTEAEVWKTGEAQFKYEFQGVCYQLSSAEELERFKASPDKFIPALHGCDPVSLLRDQVFQTGHLELGVTYQSKVYFFSSRDTRDEFLSNPEKFSRSQNVYFFTVQTKS